MAKVAEKPVQLVTPGGAVVEGREAAELWVVAERERVAQTVADHGLLGPLMALLWLGRVQTALENSGDGDEVKVEAVVPPTPEEALKRLKTL